jgi:hypothetical protein
MNGDWNAFMDSAEFWWNIYSILAILVSALFFVGFVYARIRFGQFAEIETQGLRAAEAKWAARNNKTSSRSTRWESVKARVSENNPESWRVAIIEADIMLEEALMNAGYTGQSLGEKLKSVNTHTFTSVQDAWDAHKVRNEIAHVGSDFVLTQKAAQDTIVRFERALHELGAV